MESETHLRDIPTLSAELFWVLLALSELVAWFLAIRLWSRRPQVLRGLFWSAVLLVPWLGPLFYLSLSKGLRPLREGEQAPLSDL